jgi:hypothetical protein
MVRRFAKTDAGQREIRERQHALPRGARLMLVLADGTRSDADLLEMVKGSTAQDLEALIEAGLVTALESAGARGTSPRSGGGAPEPAPPAAPAAAPAPAAGQSAPDGAITTLGYTELYQSLTAMAREQLGLIKGYRFVLDVETAMDLPALVKVAQRLVAEIEKSKGPAAAQMVRRALGMAER